MTSRVPLLTYVGLVCPSRCTTEVSYKNLTLFHCTLYHSIVISFILPGCNRSEIL